MAPAPAVEGSIPLKFGLRWSLTVLTYFALQLGWACAAGPVWLSVVPVAAAIFGGWLCHSPGPWRITRVALGAGLGSAWGLLLTDCGWHFLWPSSNLDSSWKWGLAVGLGDHASALISAFSLTSFHAAIACWMVREFSGLAHLTVARRAWLVALAIGWCSAWIMLAFELMFSAVSEFNHVLLLAWYPGELAYRAYLAAVLTLVAFPFCWVIIRHRQRRWQTHQATPGLGELEWDRDQYRPTIQLPFSK